MSKKFAWLTVAISGILGPVLVKTFFPPILFKLYMLGWFLGGIYSVPPIRTKQNPILAGLTIATVRGFLLNFGVYYAVKDAIAVAGPSALLLSSSSSIPFVWSPKVAFMARFMTIFATCIAVTKDLPDVQGDRAYQISTFATQVGVDKIAKGATALLLLNYGHAIVTGIVSAVSASAAGAAGAFRLIPMIGGHAALAAMLMVRYQQLDPDSMKSIKVYYKHIWDLFYLEYALYTLI
ncbi:UbiA prenyltransferase family [Fragilaria crotonensis]|nr:UbiA prenyltransferase family [Fragilaria crotonensis]